MEKACAICGKKTYLFNMDFEIKDTDANAKFTRYVCGSCWEVIAWIARRVTKNMLAEKEVTK